MNQLADLDPSMSMARTVEVLMRARRRGYRIVELPLVYHCPTCESRVTRLDPPRMLLDLFRIRRLCRTERRGRGDGVRR